MHTALPGITSAQVNGVTPDFIPSMQLKLLQRARAVVLVSRNKDLIEFAKKYRNYGKFDYKVHGLNYRMTEFAAAIGAIQIERLKGYNRFQK